MSNENTFILGLLTSKGTQQEVLKFDFDEQNIELVMISAKTSECLFISDAKLMLILQFSWIISQPCLYVSHMLVAISLLVYSNSVPCSESHNFFQDCARNCMLNTRIDSMQLLRGYLSRVTCQL